MRCNLCSQKIFHKRGLAIELCSSCSKELEPVLYSATVITPCGLPYRCTALFRYDKALKELVSLYKFRRELRQARTFAALMLESLNLSNEPEMIVPVPSHPLDEIKRGFSHMNHLAVIVSRGMDKQYYPVLARRLFPLFGRSQKHKHKKQRLTSGGIYLREDTVCISGKKILLLDDVMTTGATMKNCAGVLLENGAASVHGVSLGLAPY